VENSSLAVVEIDSLAPGGDAAGRQIAGNSSSAGADNEGRVVFVPLAAPGERVRVQLVREKERVAWGELVSVERAGPDRVPAPCPLFGSCGGCQWQHVTIEAQRRAKKTIVERALGLSADHGAESIAAGPPFGYRDRAKLAVGPGPAPRPLGFRARRSHEIVDVPSCPLFSPALDTALPAVRAYASQLPAGTEIDLQAGAEGVHVNAGQLDGNGAALARREADRLLAAGVAGLSIGGKPFAGRPDVDVAERGGAPLRADFRRSAAPAIACWSTAFSRPSAPRRGRCWSSTPARAISRASWSRWRRPRACMPARAIRPPWRAARARRRTRPGVRGFRTSPPTSSCSTRRARAPMRPT